MTETKIVSICGKALVVAGDDIDTDRIIPARFLKEITFANLGRYPFYDERFNEDNSEKPHPFNEPERQDAKILFVNKNFGCGSSREHAPQSLKRWGIDAIVGESFAEIFASNCITLGIPAVTVSANDVKNLQQLALADANLVWTLDLETSTLSTTQAAVSVFMPTHHKQALQQGLWDSTALLLQNLDKVRQLHSQLPYTHNYR